MPLQAHAGIALCHEAIVGSPGEANITVAGVKHQLGRAGLLGSERYALSIIGGEDPVEASALGGLSVGTLTMASGESQSTSAILYVVDGQSQISTCTGESVLAYREILLSVPEEGIHGLRHVHAWHKV